MSLLSLLINSMHPCWIKVFIYLKKSNLYDLKCCWFLGVNKKKNQIFNEVLEFWIPQYVQYGVPSKRYISLLVIFCIIVYVTNTNLESWGNCSSSRTAGALILWPVHTLDMQPGKRMRNCKSARPAMCLPVLTAGETLINAPSPVRA